MAPAENSGYAHVCLDSTGLEETFMKSAVVAFAFGVPNTLRSNRCIAEMASRKAAALRIPIYTQHEVIPVEPGVEVELTEEKHPERVPTLRIARGAVRWARRREIDEFWLCAAKPHLARCWRDLHFAIQESNAEIKVRAVQDTENHSNDFWFCSESMQADTRVRWRWQFRDAILMHMPMRLYSLIAS